MKIDLGSVASLALLLGLASSAQAQQVTFEPLPNVPNLSTEFHSIDSVVFIDKGNRLAIGGIGPAGRAEQGVRIVLLDLEQNKIVKIVEGERKPDRNISVPSIVVSEDARHLTAGVHVWELGKERSRDEVWIWDLGSGTLADRLPARVQWSGSLAISPREAVLAYSTPEGAIILRDLEKRKVRSTLPPAIQTGFFGSVLAFSPDGQEVASAEAFPSRTGLFPDLDRLRIWRTSEDRERHVLRLTDRLIVQMAYAPDGQSLITVEKLGTKGDFALSCSFREPATLATRRSLRSENPGSPVTALCPGRLRLAVSHNYNDPLRLWDLAPDRISTHPLPANVRIECLAISRDGLRVAFARPELGLSLVNLSATRP